MAETDVSPEENASRVAPATPGFLAAHRGLLWAVVGLVVALVAFTLVWFQPQKLFLNQRVNEALPLTSPTGGSAPPASSPPAGSPRPSAPGGSVPAGPSVLV